MPGCYWAKDNQVKEDRATPTGILPKGPFLLILSKACTLWTLHLNISPPGAPRVPTSPSKCLLNQQAIGSLSLQPPVQKWLLDAHIEEEAAERGTSEGF